MTVLAALAVGVVLRARGRRARRERCRRAGGRRGAGRLAARRDRADVVAAAGRRRPRRRRVLGGERVRRAAVALLVVAALTGSVFVALVPAVAVALLPRAYFGRRRRIRMREVQAAWPDGLRDLVASIAAGLSLTQAVTNLAATGPTRAARRVRASSRSWRACSAPDRRSSW